MKNILKNPRYGLIQDVIFQRLYFDPISESSSDQTDLQNKYKTLFIFTWNNEKLIHNLYYL